MPRASELPRRIGLLPSGPTRSVHDVPGAGLGHATLWLDEPDQRGLVRTGVSVLHLAGDGFGSPVPAGAAVLNGMGECTGLVTVREWGRAETPVFLTSTMQVGRVYDAACTLLARRDPRVGVDDVVIPLVGECDDCGLSDPRWARLSDDDVAAAWDSAILAAGDSGTAAAMAPAEGSVGAGTGMECLGWKGGIGTASRVLPDGHVLGAVVLANFGEGDRLTVAGVPVGQLLGRDSAGGLRHLDPYFAAAVEATEEAVITCLLAATDVTGRGGRTVAALPFADVVGLL